MDDVSNAAIEPLPCMSDASAPTHPISPQQIREIRRTRRHPRPWRSEYLHLRHLVRDLEAALKPLDGTVHDILDVFCGTRPYEDLLPHGARRVGLDVTSRYGVADVVTDEFLPFPAASFDLIICTQSLQYVPDPAGAVAEFRRVSRPGGVVLLTVPHVWEYDRGVLEHRFTEPVLAEMFEAWDDVRIVENGGRAVTWTTITGRMLGLAEWSLAERSHLSHAVAPLFSLAHLLLNGLGMLLDRIESGIARGSNTLPPNLLLTARRPSAG
jgi:SAM-dependent methyltransferase